MYRTTVEGLARLQAQVAALPAEVKSSMRGAVDQNASDFVTRLGGTVPRETGDLASTIRVEQGRSDISVNILIGDEAHPYAAAIEFGHCDGGKHVPARPFFFTLYRIMKRSFRSRVTRAMNKANKGDEGPAS